MNAFWRKGLGIALLFFNAESKSYCQVNLSKYEIGLTAGAFVYQGDLTPSPAGSYRTMKPTVNLFVNRIFNPLISLRSSLFYGGLSGNDAAYKNPAWRQQRNFSFTSKIFELSALLVYYPVNTDRKFYPYVFGGGGLSVLNIKRDWSKFNPEFFINEDVAARLSVDAGHRLPKLIPVFPVGAGIQYSLTQKLSLIAETAYRLTTTDYLDGFSKAANPNLNDHYQSHTVGLLYKFGKQSTVGCPSVQ